jgi:hypothetical protein
MKLKLLIVACFAVALSLYAAAPSFTGRAATQGQKLPGDDVIIPSVDEKWGQVKFTHQKHTAYSSCLFCHHTNPEITLESFQAGKVGKVPLCAECHVRKEGDPKTPKSADGTELWSKEAYHFNCIECHKDEITRKPKGVTDADIKKKGDGSVAVKCADCHEKKD